MADNTDVFDGSVQMAADMFERQLEAFHGQVVAPREPQRVRRLGEMPANPIIEMVAGLVPEDTGV